MSVECGAPVGPDVPVGGDERRGAGRHLETDGFEQHLETKAVAWPAG